jgi:glycosyltransferase involved in cell wall biosynthesis
MSQDKLKVLFQGWTEIPHSYSMVNCFQLVHLYKNFKDKLEIYIEEQPYFREEWNKSKKLVYTQEYNTIIKSLPKWRGEKIDVIYSITYPYNIKIVDSSVPKCVFYTSEFSWLDQTYFGPNYDNKAQVIEYVRQNKNLYFTSPSLWSARGMELLGVEKKQNRIITHGVDRTIFKVDKSKRSEVRKHYKIKDDDILMINIGAMTQNKGIVQILQALNVLVNVKGQRQYKLLLKGTGDLYTSKGFLEAYIQGLQRENLVSKVQMDNLLDNHIIFSDKTLSYERINDLFNASDLYLSPYLAEGFNLTVLESLSAGLSVLVPETGSTKEYINDLYENGGETFINKVKSQVLVFENGMMQNNIRVDDLVDSIELLKLSGDVSDHERLAEYIEENYSWNKVSKMLYEYFREIRCNYFIEFK